MGDDAKTDDDMKSQDELESRRLLHKTYVHFHGVSRVPCNVARLVAKEVESNITF